MCVRNMQSAVPALNINYMLEKNKESPISPEHLDFESVVYA